MNDLFAAAQRGEIDRREARARLDHMRALKIRLLGDRAQQQTAWDVADRLGWADTFAPDYVALATLQADALVTLDAALARVVEGIVPLADDDALFA